MRLPAQLYWQSNMRLKSTTSHAYKYALYFFTCFLCFSVGFAHAKKKETSVSVQQRAERKDQKKVLLTGIYFDGYLKGNPEPDSAIRISNVTDRAIDLSGYALIEYSFSSKNTASDVSLGEEQDDSDSTDVSSSKSTKKRKSSSSPVRVTFPAGAQIKPHEDIWVATQGQGFALVFGRAPRFETEESMADVDNVSGPQGFLKMPSTRGQIALLNAAGEMIDAVCYDNRTPKEREKAQNQSNSDPSVMCAALGSEWVGAAVPLSSSSPYAWTGQVLARDRRAFGGWQDDTNTWRDWDSGFSRKQLGEEPVHRVEMAGQTQFSPRPLKKIRAKLLATSAPDNNHAALVEAIDAAKKTVWVRIYEFTNLAIADALLRAQQRGVNVIVYVEGAPVGGIADQERYLLSLLDRAGVPIYFLASPTGEKRKPRYRFDHSKYVIIDGKRAIIGTENYGRTGVPTDPSYGNRGWMVHIENADLVEQLSEVWRADLQLSPQRMLDLVAWRDDSSDPYGLPYRNPQFRPDAAITKGLYKPQEKPVLVDDTMDIELVLSPDTSLNEEAALIGLIGRAEKTLYIEQNSVRRVWGRRIQSRDENMGMIAAAEGDNTAFIADDANLKNEETPDLLLQAVVAAARRGVSVRVMLDSTWYNVQGDDERDNDDTVKYLNDLARDEKLDIVAKVINLRTTHVEKIHAKGIIVDDKEVFVGSINWSENSFKGNREVGVVIGHPKVAGYYSKLFLRDWSQSRIYSATIAERTTLANTAGEQVSADAAENKAGNEQKNARIVEDGERLSIVAEHQRFSRPWAEVSLGLGKTAFIEADRLSEIEITSGEAIHVVDRDVLLTGRVAQTNVAEKYVQLRLEVADRPPCTVVIFKNKWNAFTSVGIDVKEYWQGKEIAVHGRVLTYKSPEIIVNDPAQIQVIKTE